MWFVEHNNIEHTELKYGIVLNVTRETGLTY